MSHFTFEFAFAYLEFTQSMLKVEHTFELQNLYNLRFIESEICLGTKLNLSKKTDSNLFMFTTSEF